MKPAGVQYVAKEKRQQTPKQPQPKASQPKGPKRSNKPSIAAWKERTEQTHKQHMEELNAGSNVSCDVLLIGSSMFERWKTSGLEGWNNSKLHTQKIFNAGVGGDKVQNVLYRLEHGLLSPSFQPKLIVLQIGTNNIEQDHPEDICDGISVALAKIQELSPLSKIILLGILPRNDVPSINPKVLALNQLLSQKQTDKITYYEFTNLFLKEDETVKPDFYDDKVHLNAAGYSLWSEPLSNVLN